MLVTYMWENWRYSNAPEGQRPFEKVVGLTKYGLAGSAGVGIYDCILISQTAGFWQTVNCMSFWVVPVTAMCATFASVAYATTKIRGKDGYFNYILASLAAGGISYPWLKNGPFSYHLTMVIIGCAVTKKFGDLSGWNPLPLNPEIRRQYTTFPFDFTLIKDTRGPRPWE
ncbi:PREDICTED: uncharacterized protein LOC105457029 [Wasmannia auropunctata]|uniref:uncharacterized protein LOC105457029 n=1 Tax=Wasmannia auropunctata TaxID=64793 RepID=UPI0005EF7C50|nr:PREDICTED: uncharacterized protein LOC105457029 [Wasmannia auropunctata]XP_011699737.1 PREDICTED: uncharacterized protein LOC105457029 [Wasmannia auropunctata]XP_011699739.1 PREDICTED: uncharacterized protein LOC105457029 [Wasmannia auropunctata]XP_011699740.1 PREDICTED: uncharacterized protein LOC105457029 [Wasmannia auropunctata]